MDVDYRRQRAVISEEADPIHRQSRGKSSISSLLLSTFSNNSDEDQPCKNDEKKEKTKKKNKKKSSSSRLRGLGCSAASSQQVSVPAVIRTSADWEAHRKRKPKKGAKDRNALLLDGSCQDVWCDAAASVDCVVARARNVGNGSRGKIDSANNTHHGHREQRACIARRTVVPEPASYFETETEMLSERADSDVFGGRYFRHPSPDGLAEIMILQGGLIMGGRVDIQDRFRDMRLDVDNMSYEELLDLGERIGYVSTGLKGDEIGRCIRKMKLSISNEYSSHMATQVDRKCSICQEEYEGNDEMGKLNCGHGFHMECITLWLSHKNTCPVCKSEAVARPR